MVAEVGGPKTKTKREKALRALLTSGLIEPHPVDGYQMHDYSDWAPSRETVEKRKAAAKDRKEKWQRKQDGHKPENTSGAVVRTPAQNAPGTRSEPVPNKSSRNARAGGLPSPPLQSDPLTTTGEDAGPQPCPPDLALASDQRATLESSMIPGYAIDESTRQFIASSQADPNDRRTLVVWRKCLSKAVAGDWNDPRKRPRKPDAPDLPSAAAVLAQARGES